jgi:hypothetical protein
LSDKQIESCYQLVENYELNNESLMKLVKGLTFLNQFDLANKIKSRIDPLNKIDYVDKMFLRDCLQLDTFTSNDL